MSDPICVRDYVQLNSGGPEMQVTAIDEAGQATCQLPGEMGEARFPVACLELVRSAAAPQVPSEAAEASDA
jgi:uncharacterized protein YodC (DUF2158 family)